jgi:hypothetical protein
MYRSTVGMTSADQACYNQVFPETPDEMEWLGTGDGAWWRGAQNEVLEEQGPADVTETGVDLSKDSAWVPLADGNGQYHVSTAGTPWRSPGIGDPWHGALPPDTYTCGWVNRRPPPYDGPWELAIGALVPDGAFLDRCNEAVSLHQFAGSWLVIAVGAMDCGPCQSMAADEPGFIADNAGKVEVVTLLTHLLSHPSEATERVDIDAWADSFGLESPVLRDRAWGSTLVDGFFPNSSPFPATIVVGPDGRVRDLWLGYNADSGDDLVDLSWGRVTKLIAAESADR